ncbi:pentatricopeptide repeat-containing protein At1g11290, chloroplastic [Impatiens glandulifera]|uniref:pentatricopeptide repeat-containing protein At1g11290, chloroplastic n=1 Tax=Impatiens glandulifera TaxID=253017 RepID=UPI001FB10333|nr:pentatricopeptide repeat-containing protein At1g11290, chloroplastic [Impatiens glandulifera]
MRSLIVSPSSATFSTSPSSSPPSLPFSHSLSSRVYIPAHVYKHPCALLLEHCTSMKELNQFLPLIIKNGLYSEHLFQTKLIGLFNKFGRPIDAARVFDPMEGKVDAVYRSMLKGYTRNSSLNEALSFFVRMKADGINHVVYDFAYLLKACADNSDVRRGREVQAQLIVNGYAEDVFITTAVVNLYAKCGLIYEAYKMFDRMPQRDLVCWNTIIAGHAQNGFAEKALGLVSRMQEEGNKPDFITIVSILPAVANTQSVWIGKSIHGYVIRAGFESMVNVLTALVDMYSKCGYFGVARLIFDHMPNRNAVSWNSMIDGYTQNGDSEQALLLFERMMDQGLKPTNVTIMHALHACADLGDINRGESVHKLADELGLSSDVSITNSLISMYCKNKRADLASKLFDKMPMKTLVSWNAMILGHAQNGNSIEALTAFYKMHEDNIRPDSFTMVGVIPALAELSVPRLAKWIHGLSVRTRLDKNDHVTTALVDMYAKCGAIRTARRLFDAIDDHPHVTTWNAMIDGYGTHGLGKEAVEVFEEMLNGPTKPNDVTFLCIISACSHSGMVDEGRRFFSMMEQDYGLTPSKDHYGAIVDLLGRAGQLSEAWGFIQSMPIEPEINVFGAMLGACKIHKNIDFGEMAAKKLFELHPNEGGYHVLLANIYAGASMWDKVSEVRTTMKRKGLLKTPGCSLVDVQNEVHTFYSGSTNHPQSSMVYAYLGKLIDRIKVLGYLPDTNQIHDVEEDVQMQLLGTHSEKLAIAFAILNTKPGSTIHIRKNLRVCTDCHNATKYISLDTGREIIVRDMHRFHHFKNGECSCGDYW